MSKPLPLLLSHQFQHLLPLGSLPLLERHLLHPVRRLVLRLIQMQRQVLLIQRQASQQHQLIQMQCQEPLTQRQVFPLHLPQPHLLPLGSLPLLEHPLLRPTCPYLSSSAPNAPN